MNEQNLKEFREKNKNLFTAFIVILSIFLVVLIFSTVVDIQNKIKEGKYIGQDVEVKNTITVSDTGEIYAKPDLVLITFSVVTEGKTVAETMKENTKKMNAVVDFMKNQGIKDKDLKTTDFVIYPRYEWHKETSLFPTGKRVLVGYEVRQSLEVKIRDMEKIGDIIQGATDMGANQMGNLQFTIDKQDELKKQAREEAIKKAKAKAKELASQLGVRLVRITSFNESIAIPRFPYLEGTRMMGEGVPQAPQTPQIETGENKISVTVNITYEID